MTKYTEKNNKPTTPPTVKKPKVSQDVNPLRNPTYSLVGGNWYVNFREIRITRYFYNS